MITSETKNGVNKPQKTYLDQMLERLSPSDREMVLKLCLELGIPQNDPAFLLPVFLYQPMKLITEVPSRIESSNEVALNKMLTAYNVIQSQIDESIEQIEEMLETSNQRSNQVLSQTVNNINNARSEWIKEVKKVLVDAKKSALEEYKASAKKIDEKLVASQTKQLEHLQEYYLGDVRKQGFIQALGSTALACLACLALGFNAGMYYKQQQMIQNFGSAEKYKFANDVMNYGDNVDRFNRCIADNNPKCTIWITEPQ
jgi:vacuolar-type H+-ATPase subunit H